MISIATSEGRLLKVFTGNDSFVFGFHSVFGWITESGMRAKAQLRKRMGLRLDDSEWLFKIKVKSLPANQMDMEALTSAIQVDNLGEYFELRSTLGTFQIRVGELAENLNWQAGLGDQPSESNRWFYGAMVMLVCGLLSISLLKKAPENLESTTPVAILEPVEVKVVKQEQRTVQVARENVLASKTSSSETPGGAMVAQKLGFLSLLGKKDLKKAVGGAPTELANASPGAGPGGMEGSGGELLVGLGQGVKKTTVGNSGVAGLGGVGLKGAGGGGGGFGTSSIGSGGMGNSLRGIGDGKRVSTAALHDEITLEGGLDKAVIQATIAKYLGQVRACYEESLRKKPGLSGQVTMNFEVGGGGNLNYAKVAKSSLEDAEAERCIAMRMKDWLFPKPVGGVNVKVAYPFFFRPTGN